MIVCRTVSVVPWVNGRGGDGALPATTNASSNSDAIFSFASSPCERALRCGALFRLRRARLARLRRRVDQVPQAALEALGHAGLVNYLGVSIGFRLIIPTHVPPLRRRNRQR